MKFSRIINRLNSIDETEMAGMCFALMIDISLWIGLLHFLGIWKG